MLQRGPGLLVAKIRDFSWPPPGTSCGQNQGLFRGHGQIVLINVGSNQFTERLRQASGGQLMGRRAIWVTLVVALFGVIGALIFIQRTPPTSSVTSQASLTGTHPASSGGPPNTTARGPTFESNPIAPAIICNQDKFFGGAANLATITEHMGPLWYCARFTADNQWILWFGGVSISSNLAATTSPAPYGTASFALETCAPSDQSCLSGTTTHSFGNFLVYRPPYNPVYFPHPPTVMSVRGDRLITVFDGKCGFVTFDFLNRNWYKPSGSPSGEASAYAGLMSGSPGAAPKFQDAPSAEAGNQALADNAAGSQPPAACPQTS